MEPILITLGKDVEQKRLRIVKEGLVVEKHFCEHADVLAVNLERIII